MSDVTTDGRRATSLPFLLMRIIAGAVGGALSGAITASPLLLRFYGFIVDGSQNLVRGWTIFAAIVGATVGIIAVMIRRRILYAILIIAPVLAVGVLLLFF